MGQDWRRLYAITIEVENLHKPTSSGVIKALFARYGVPDTVILDNGLQFASKEFSSFAGIFCIPRHNLPTHSQMGKQKMQSKLLRSYSKTIIMYRYMKVKQLEAAITTIYIGYWNFGNDQLINRLISESAQYY